MLFMFFTQKQNYAFVAFFTLLPLHVDNIFDDGGEDLSHGSRLMQIRGVSGT